MTELKKIVVFKFDDSIEYKVPYEYAKISDLVKDLLNESFIDTDEEILPVDKEKVNPIIFEKVIQYMEHYYIEPMTDFETPIKSMDISELVQEYYVKYLYGKSNEDITQENVKELRELILISNFLGIQPLLKFTLVKLGILTQENQDIIEKTFSKNKNDIDNNNNNDNNITNNKTN